jgi:hypothetical protein
MFNDLLVEFSILIGLIDTKLEQIKIKIKIKNSRAKAEAQAQEIRGI